MQEKGEQKMRPVQITRHMYSMGNDLVICIQNENGHIGSVVTGEPYYKNNELHSTYNTFNRLTHKDDCVAKLYVEKAVQKYQCVVTCICGIHLDDITQDEMQEIMNWVKQDLLNL